MSLDKAIKSINPNAEFKIDNDDIDNITWLNETTPISKADIEAKLPLVEFETSLKNLRKDRNKLLADSDWEVIMAKEKGTNLSSAFKTWRQDLRDITEGLTTVEEVEGVVFPEKP